MKGTYMTEPTVCNWCWGEGWVYEKLRDLGGRDGSGVRRLAVVVCDQCEGKGFFTAEDHARRLANFMCYEDDPQLKEAHEKLRELHATDQRDHAHQAH